MSNFADPQHSAACHNILQYGLKRGANALHMVQLMLLSLYHLCSSKIQNVLPFWRRLIQDVLEKRLSNGCSSSSTRHKTMQDNTWNHNAMHRI